MKRLSAPVALLCIFTVSGFSALIYESIWSHYLKLFLGHAAYSQVLVLVIFMGGMAIGSALAGRFSTRWTRVLLAYALVEAITGALALLFHGAFDRVTQASFAHVIPHLDSETAVHAYKWGLGALMILPQSILLGMTFPLMSAGFVRLVPDRAGRSVAMLYFTNSMGGAVGVLMSGFALIPEVGLPGAMMTAGLLNFLVALATWLLVRNLPETQLPAGEPATMQAPMGGGEVMNYRFLLLASLVTGMASFCYEIGWLRMLSPVLGASTHAFELMLSSFILGLALGGYWIRKRIDGSRDPRVLLAVIQLAMGLLALLTLFIYGSTFEWMAAVMSTFARTDQGYVGFNWASHAIASAVMLPTTFCAGMTLPLITYSAMRSGAGERAIGGVYAANTVGAILGVALSVHILMPVFNSKGVIIGGAALDFGLGLILLRGTVSASRFPRVALASFVGSIAFLWALLAAEVDPMKIVSSVFRHGISRSTDDEVLYLRDGKTATVSLSRKNTVVSLATNGKVDASVNMGDGPATEDEETQSLLGAVPLMLHPSAKTVAVIGFGSGMSSNVLLGDTRLERVDTIEIEGRMVEAAHRGFYPRNRLAYEDPRSHVYVEDAKTFFSLTGRKYDIILSEPSNPWVSGVSSLFTYEFYRHIVDYLNNGGLLAQWMQLYEIDSNSLASVVKALSPWFTDYAIYMADDDNILIIARRGGALGYPGSSAFSQPGMRDQLARVGVLGVDDVRSRWIGNKALLDPYFRRSAAPMNSDYFPFIDHQAPKARFMKADALELTRLNAAGLPIPEMLSGRDGERHRWQELAQRNPSDRKLAQLVIRSIREGKDSALLGPIRQDVVISILGADQCGGKLLQRWETAWTNVGRYAVRYLDREEASAFFGRLLPPRCRAGLSARGKVWLELLESVAGRNADAMVLHARRLLALSDAKSSAGDTLYAAGVTMLGLLVRGEPRQAIAIKQELTGKLLPNVPLPFEILWMESIARGGLSADQLRPASG
jgi:spermidine synthase